MKKLLLILGMLWASIASAQFTPGQLLTAAELNSQFALYARLAGGTFSGPVTVPTLNVTGSFTIPASTIPLTALAPQAANTVIANATAGSASPTAVTVTGCNGAAQALQWTNGSGFGCNSTIATSGANANITSLSGLSTALSVAQGGTGRATLTTHGVLVGEGTSAINQLAVGTTGQMLLGVTGADPAFGNNATITSGTITSTPISGSTGSFTTVAASSTITPSSTAGIVGTTTNDNANAGSEGEFVSSTVLIGSAVAATSGTPLNVTSISLTAGDWDVWGNVITNPAGTTVTQLLQTSISTTSATMALAPAGGFNSLPLTTSAGGFLAILAGTTRISVASTTTVYLVADTFFTTSTSAVYGFIGARRRR